MLSVFSDGTKTLYRIFLIKRRGRLFKTQARIPGVYSNPAFIRDPAFIYQVHFSAIHFLLSVLEFY